MKSIPLFLSIQFFTFPHLSETKYIYNLISDSIHHDEEWSRQSRNITNDVLWRDNYGNVLRTGCGGKISIIDTVWYWVGCEPSPLAVSYCNS